MDVILGLSFGSCLGNRHPTPGVSNVSLALQIMGRMKFSAVEKTVLIVDVPIACALNSMGVYPDRILSSSLEGDGGALSDPEFFERVARSLRDDPLPLPPQGERVYFTLAVQSVCAPRALRHAWELVSPDVRVLSNLPVPCDPLAAPWHARSLWYATLHEWVAAFCEE